MRLQKTTVLAASIMTAGALIAAVPAQAETTTEVLREANIDFTSTRATGHYEFLDSGLHVWTESNTSTDKVAGYWPRTGTLPAAASINWIGTDPAASTQIKFDIDGDANTTDDRGTLVGEVDYYGENFWLTPTSSQAAKDADPSGAENGGNGSEWFGTLAQWKANLPDTTQVYVVGFSLGSGVKGDGYIENVTIDDTVYTFTGAPVAEEPTAWDVRGKHTTMVKGRTVRIDMRSWGIPEGNYVEGDRLAWRILVDGRVALSNHQSAREHDFWVERFVKGTDRHLVQVLENGKIVQTFRVDAGR